MPADYGDASSARSGGSSTPARPPAADLCDARQEALLLHLSDYLKPIFVDPVTPQALTVRTALEFHGPDKVIFSATTRGGAQRPQSATR